MAQPICVGMIVDFELATPIDNGEALSLSGATVTLYLRKPGSPGNVSDGTLLTFSATVSGNSTDGWYANYSTSTSDISVAGTWFKSWKVVKTGYLAYTVPEEFQVFTSP